MAGFLVEFRLKGYARKYASWARARTIREAKRLGVRRCRERRFVPHITLFGQAETDSIRHVTREAERIGRKYTLVPFKLGIERGDFKTRDANWLYLKLGSSPALEQLRHELAQSLLKSERRIRSSCPSHDRSQRYKFHCSIGKYDPRDRAQFEQLAEYAETQCSVEAFRRSRASPVTKLFEFVRRHLLRTGEEHSPAVNQHLLRITILGKRGRIQAEYDLVLKRILSRRQALSRYWWRRTIEKLMELQSTPSAQEPTPVSDRPVYFFGDAHFDHKNIIKHCCRNFSDVTEMNQAIIDNWNCTVGDDETVYYLGDWAFGWRHKPARHWKNQLKGTIVSIRGSHDRDQSGMGFHDFRELRVGKYDFLLIHDPDPAGRHQTQEQTHKLENWHGWIIHGHVHSNKMDRYPFINGENRTINVSAEVVKYRPVSLSYLLSLDLESIRRMRMVDSEPERW